MKRKVALWTALVAVLAAAASTYAWASSQATSTQTINACVSDDGLIRLAASTGVCKRGETPISWNTVGPVGPAGTAGLQGVAGRDGRDGQPGPQGPPGTVSDLNAVTATISVTGAKQGSFSTQPIPVIALSHAIISPRDAASGLPTGKRQHQPIVIVKHIDAATPLLLNALVTNENLSSVTITLAESGTNVMTIKLTNGGIAQYASHGETETWSFTYQKIEWTWIDGGITAQDDWESTP